jgi:hypothetical protein
MLTLARTILSRTKANPWLFSLWAATAAILPPLALVALLSNYLPLAHTEPFHPIIDTAMPLLVAPIIESALLIPTMFLAEKIARGTIAPSLLCALAWAALHGITSPAQVAAAFWAFFIFSLTLLHWRERLPNSYYWVLVLTHFLANLPSTILLAFDLV